MKHCRIMRRTTREFPSAHDDKSGAREFEFFRMLEGKMNIVVLEIFLFIFGIAILAHLISRNQ
jgi:hypothetical protein